MKKKEKKTKATNMSRELPELKVVAKDTGDSSNTHRDQLAKNTPQRLQQMNGFLDMLRHIDTQQKLHQMNGFLHKLRHMGLQPLVASINKGGTNKGKGRLWSFLRYWQKVSPNAQRRLLNDVGTFEPGNKQKSGTMMVMSEKRLLSPKPQHTRDLRRRQPDNPSGKTVPYHPMEVESS
jgi:hypothetical protein